MRQKIVVLLCSVGTFLGTLFFGYWELCCSLFVFFYNNFEWDLTFIFLLIILMWSEFSWTFRWQHCPGVVFLILECFFSVSLCWLAVWDFLALFSQCGLLSCVCGWILILSLVVSLGDNASWLVSRVYDGNYPSLFKFVCNPDTYLAFGVVKTLQCQLLFLNWLTLLSSENFLDAWGFSCSKASQVSQHLISFSFSWHKFIPCRSSICL